jgi:hypothetical protein
LSFSATAKAHGTKKTVSLAGLTLTCPTKEKKKRAARDVNERWKALEELASEGNGATVKPAAGS